MRQTFPSITAETPEVVFASDASMTMTPDPIAQAEAVARIRDDLTLNADPILSFLDRLVEDGRCGGRAIPHP
jgi:hypothetical protein